ncbi:MAG: hypothetical protein WBM50_25415 [Acidimicrobiales bacterium]
MLKYTSTIRVAPIVVELVGMVDSLVVSAVGAVLAVVVGVAAARSILLPQAARIGTVNAPQP